MRVAAICRKRYRFFNDTMKLAPTYSFSQLYRGVTAPVVWTDGQKNARGLDYSQMSRLQFKDRHGKKTVGDLLLPPITSYSWIADLSGSNALVVREVSLSLCGLDLAYLLRRSHWKTDFSLQTTIPPRVA